MAWSGYVLSYVNASNPTTLTSGLETPIRIDYPPGRLQSDLANGTAAAQIDLGWTSYQTYSTSGTTHALNALTAAATNSGAATFSATKYIGLWNVDSAIDLVMGNGATPHNFGLSAATTTLTVQELGHSIHYNPTAAGWTTSSATDLKIVSASGTPYGVLVILGED